jgi:hypothetical protein
VWRGRPPPRRSSIAGKPVESRGEPEEEGRVPGRGEEGVRRRKEDMAAAVEDVGEDVQKLG